MGITGFNSGTNNGFSNTASQVALTMPVSLGGWFLPFSIPLLDAMIFSLENTSTTTWTSLSIRATTGIPGLDVGGTVTDVSTSKALIAGGWHYAVVRGIGTNSKRLDLLYPDGVIDTVNDVAANAGTLGRFQLSCGVDFGTPFDGLIAEIWTTNTDIGFPADSVLDPGFLRRLAINGPFRYFPRSIREYLPLIRQPPQQVSATGPISFRFPSTDYYSSIGSKNWSSDANIIAGTHPPLPSNYLRPPGQRPGVMITR